MVSEPCIERASESIDRLDLAISAPGEKDDIHTGSVYIYFGSRTNQLSNYVQKIVPSQFSMHLKHPTAIHDFGFSLASQSPFSPSSPALSPSTSSSNVSAALIDYPSLIIGVPKANMIVYLRWVSRRCEELEQRSADSFQLASVGQRQCSDQQYGRTAINSIQC